MQIRTIRARSAVAIVGALALFAAAVGSGGLVAAQTADVTYTVEVENLSSGQPFTPPLIAAHTSGTSVFRVGEAASGEVQEIAENGNLAPLSEALAVDAAVIATTSGGAPVLPGETATLTIEAPPGIYLSWVSMLICTNDGFVGIDSLSLQATGSQTVDKDAYDAGTETNTEDFADMVPPCQGLVGVSSDDEGTGASSPDLAEGGVITSHAGIQGGVDLTIADHSWTDPIARVTITAPPSSLPPTGGATSGDELSIWLVVVTAGGAALVLASVPTFMIARRTVR